MSEPWCAILLPLVVYKTVHTNDEQIWDLFEGKHLFYGNDPDGKGYSARAYLAEVIGMLGPPPPDLLKRGKRSAEFFDDDGMYDARLVSSNLPFLNRYPLLNLRLSIFGPLSTPHVSGDSHHRSYVCRQLESIGRGPDPNRHESRKFRGEPEGRK